MTKHLQKAAHDESPSVAIAACDGLLKSQGSGGSRRSGQSIDRACQRGKVGHFAAIAAMNVIGYERRLGFQDEVEIAELPRQVSKPPVRVGKYVGKLIDHAIKLVVSNENTSALKTRLIAISVRFENFDLDGVESGYVSAERDGYFDKSIAGMLRA